MDLYLVRHAIAEPRDAERFPDDSRRPLTPKGAGSFRVAARGLRALGIEVDVVLSSRYARAWQTAELLEAEAGWPAPTACRPLEPGNPPGAGLDPIGERSERSVALVGHEPHLTGLASLLITRDPDAVALELKKGGVICLRTSGNPEPGAAVLSWSASPKMLRRLASPAGREGP